MRVCQSISEFQDDFEVGKTLGMGGFAVVKMCKKKATGVMHAVKVVDKTRYQPGDQSLAREVAVLQTVMHSNCMRLDEVYVTPRHVLVVSELAEGGELHTELVRRGRFPEAEAASITKQILKGVQYLHSCGIVHRDLKLENILFSDKTPQRLIKLCDFGLSKVFGGGEQLETMCGSPQYVAPEILAIAAGMQQPYTPAVDMWSAGVILYMLLVGFSPFEDDNDAVLFSRIRRGEYSMDEPEWADVSDAAKEVVRGLMNVDTAKRWTAEVALAHPWLASAYDPGAGAAPMAS
eukprot:PRCOL_00005666-RA